MIKEATQVAQHIMKNIEGDMITEEFLTKQITNKFNTTGIKGLFQFQDFCGNHPYLVLTGCGLVSLSCLYSTFRAIKCGIKYAKKSKKQESK